MIEFLDKETEHFSDRLMEEFEVVEKIGQGAFSTVFKVRSGEQLFAIKIVDKVQQNSKVLEKLEMEAQTLSLFDHPNIIRFIKTIESKRKYYFVIEFFEGQSLQQLLENRRFELSMDEIIEIIKQICNAVAHIHSKNVIHRDLKPDNILVDSDLNIKIIDFGLSLQSMRMTSHDNCGTLLYMAPEVIQKKEYFKAIDVWSIGIMQYTMINKRHPFFDQDNAKSYAKKLSKDLRTQYYDMNPRAISFFTKTAAKEPDSRMSAAQCLEHPWITGLENSRIMTSKELIGALRGQLQVTKILKAIIIIQKLRSYVELTEQMPIQHQRQKSEALITPLSYRLDTYKSFLTVQDGCKSSRKLHKSQPRDHEDLAKSTLKQQVIQSSSKKSLKLPPIYKKPQVFVYSPQSHSPQQSQIISNELKKSSFRFK